MKKILFRADAKPSIGIGDLMSLIHLSKYFERDGWEAHFMVRNYPAGIELVEKNKIKFVNVLPGDISVSEEVLHINDYVAEHDINMVFFEITEFKLVEYNGLSSKVKKACVSFDGAIPHGLDLVIDWDVEADKFFDTARFPETNFLLGPEFVILPISFDFSRVVQRKYKRVADNLLVCMGGADEHDFTKKIVDVLINNQIRSKITVILGSGYVNELNLRQSLLAGGLDFNIKKNVQNMFEEYLACDVAVGAGGLTSSELVATRTPSILVATYQHQVARCNYFHSLGVATYLGFRSFDADVLLDKIFALTPPPYSIEFKPEAIVSACNEVAN